MLYFIVGKHCRDYYAPFIIVCIISCIFFSGCNRQKKVLPTQYGYVSYIIQWDSILNDETPKETMRFCFYSADNGPMIQTDTNSDSLKIALAPGKYGLLVYNYGDNHLQLKNRTDFERAEATFITDENGCSLTPSTPLYGVVIREFEVLPNQDVITTIAPTLFTKRVFFRINFKEEHLPHIRDCQGMLTGVTPQLHVSNQTLKRDSTTSLSVFLEKMENSYQGKILLLDGAYHEKKPDEIIHELTLHLSLMDGNIVSTTLNVGSSIFNIKKQDILVDINAYIDMDTDQKIRLECGSIDVYRKGFIL